jgi:hypothetical protein
LSSLASAMRISTFPTSSNSLASVDADILNEGMIADKMHYGAEKAEGDEDRWAL